MDVDDVSAEPEYVKLLESKKATLEASAKRRGELLETRKTRNESIMEFMAYLAHQHALAQDARLQAAFVTFPYPPCVAPLASLQRILQRELQLEVRHRGRYMLLRVVTAPCQLSLNGVMTVVEDEDGDLNLLAAYHQERVSERNMQGPMCLRSVCIVKEPFFRISGDGKYVISVIHLSDLFWLAIDDERIPPAWRVESGEPSKSADERKRAGDRAFRLGCYHLAVNQYSLALGLPATAEERQKIRISRAGIFFQMGRFDAAVRDALAVGPHEPQVPMSRAALDSLAAVAYELERFQEAKHYLEQILQVAPDSGGIRMALSRCQRRLREQETGEYDFEAMYKSASSGSKVLRHATYSALVEVRASEGRGRGLFATSSVKAGELLMCERAFAHCRAASDRDGPAPALVASLSPVSLLFNLKSNRIVLGTQASLITSIVQKLHRNPSLIQVFMSLHHGSYEPVDMMGLDRVPVVDTMELEGSPAIDTMELEGSLAIDTMDVDRAPVVDTFLVDQIVSLNAMGCPTSSRFNAISYRPRMGGNPATRFGTTGIWLRASHINHSCWGNVRRSFIGDMLILRATQDIAAGTELTFSYFNDRGPAPALRNPKLLEHWGFECSCAMCADAKNTSSRVLQRRRVLVAEVDSALRQDMLSNAEALIDVVNRMYQSPVEQVPRPVLASLHLNFAHSYIGPAQKPMQAANSALDALGCQGFIIKGGRPFTDSDLVVERWGIVQGLTLEIWGTLALAYLGLELSQLYEAAKGLTKICYRMRVGEDTTFEETFQKYFLLEQPKAENQPLTPPLAAPLQKLPVFTLTKH